MKSCRPAYRLAWPLAMLLLAASWSGPARADEGGVYISGQGATLDQAVDQALAERSREATERFWIVVSGSEVGKLTRRGAGQEVAARIREVRELGGVVYVCASDLARHAISEDELLEGVERVSGFESSGTGLPAAHPESGLPTSVPQSRLILRSCADEDRGLQ